MNPPDYKRTDGFYVYLNELSDELKNRDKWDLGEELFQANLFCGGSSSEWLHEVQVVLKKIRNDCTSVLSASELSDVSTAIDQVDLAFKKVGGA
jgi:hypothetical protein